MLNCEVTLWSQHGTDICIWGPAGSVVDSWDRVREQAVAALMRLPAPLPGLAACEALKPQLHWACSLLCSPRVREADAGKQAASLFLVGAFHLGCADKA